MKTIHIIATGGTIDSYYDGSKDTAVPREHSIIPECLKKFNLHVAFQFSEVCMKDSRELTIDDMTHAAGIAQNTPHKHVLVTHGTYNMVKTALYFKEHLTCTDKVIILTGGFIPIDGFTQSDGLFNLGFSLAKFDSLDPGVYVCMNGSVFSPEETTKIVSEGKFVALSV